MGEKLSTFGWAVPVVWATIVVEPGAVRYMFRFAAVVVQVSDAWIGTDVSVTLIDHVWEIVPAVSTWPVSVSVTVAAAALDTDSRAITRPRSGARRRHAGSRAKCQKR